MLIAKGSSVRSSTGREMTIEKKKIYIASAARVAFASNCHRGSGKCWRDPCGSVDRRWRPTDTMRISAAAQRGLEGNERAAAALFIWMSSSHDASPMLCCCRCFCSGRLLLYYYCYSPLILPCVPPSVCPFHPRNRESSIRIAGWGGGEARKYYIRVIPYYLLLLFWFGELRFAAMCDSIKMLERKKKVML